MKLRKEFHFYAHSVKNPLTEQQITYIAPLWLEPLRREQNKVLRLTILLIPFFIFTVSCILIVYSWISPNMSIGEEYLNRYFFGGLYLLCGGLLVYGFLKIIKDIYQYKSEILLKLGKN